MVGTPCIRVALDATGGNLGALASQGRKKERAMNGQNARKMAGLASFTMLTALFTLLVFLALISPV